VSELVDKETAAFAGVGIVAAFIEEDIPADGAGLGLDGLCCGDGIGSGVNADMMKIAAEVRREVGAGLRIESAAGRVEGAENGLCGLDGLRRESNARLRRRKSANSAGRGPVGF
jgi:hypothetical protein